MAKTKKPGRKTRLAVISSLVTILMLLMVTPSHATNVTIWVIVGVVVVGIVVWIFMRRRTA